VHFDEDSNLLIWRSNALTSVFASAGNISVSDITQVLRGIHTDVLLKAKQLDPSTCLSIMTLDRSLDLVFDSSLIRDKTYKSLERIIQTQGTPMTVKYL